MTWKRDSTYDRESLAAYWGTRHFIHVVEGRLTTLFTDHKPLTYMFTHKHEKYVDRQVRQISFLSQYIHAVEHIQGTDNIVPDALSGLPGWAIYRQLGYLCWTEVANNIWFATSRQLGYTNKPIYQIWVITNTEEIYFFFMEKLHLKF